MQIIGLHGKARSGKDTIADYLVEQYGFVKFGFADALYKEVAEAFSVAPFFLQDVLTKDRPSELMRLWRCKDEAFKAVALNKLAEDAWARDPGVATHLNEKYGVYLGFDHETNISPRWIMQVWGTEYRRGQNPDYWVQKASDWFEDFIESLRVWPEDVARYNEEAYAYWNDNADDDDREAGWQPELAYEIIHYQQHPGIVNVNVRFQNEYDWIKHQLWGEIWHVQRQGSAWDMPISDHISEVGLPLLTGDKLFLNYGSVEAVGTGVTLMRQGNSIVNTGVV